MNARALVLLLPLLAACAGPGRPVEPLPGETPGHADPLDRARRGVVSLIVERPGGGDSFGSGVVYDDHGTILTVHHVVEHATRIVVLLPDGFTVRARVVASDPVADLAVLRAEAAAPGIVRPVEFEPLPPRPGEQVWSLGNPFGTSRFGGEVSISRGVLSAVRRSYFNEETGRLYLGGLQHDAPTNPGNSGGGLFNSRGRLIGINALITTSRDVPGDSGVAFALPAPVVREVAATLLRGEQPLHGWLGEENFRQATELYPNGLGRLRTVFGAVAPFGPAERAGVRSGDVIIRLGEREMFGLHEVLSAADALVPGTVVPLTIHRDGTEMTLTLQAGQRPWRGQ
ncbi:MAG: trypsin-like peptidase domain-containing protein [Planctomycetes bacterium]|jgi:S1-C subfamily serine protease|nr:trypsin-like peptidase domain-containing protein [Planctomycetota bacterium]MCL4730725.1 trypsin-like peptidase domain-containing protein [Planctomycetota bacterium]